MRCKIIATLIGDAMSINELSFHNVDQHAGDPVLKTHQMSKNRGCDVVVYIVGVLAIGDVQGVDADSEAMIFETRRERRKREVPVDLHVQREVRREALAVRPADVVVEHIHIGVSESGVKIHHWADRKPIGQVKHAGTQ